MKSSDEGIFLHRIAYSDSSLITTFYTREMGLRKFIFKGGKKKAHQLFPLSVSELTYYGRQDSELLSLTAVEPIHKQQFQFDPLKSTIAFFVAETIRKCVIDSDTDTAMYDFLVEQILRLDSEEAVTMFPISFLVNFSEIIGIQPLIEENGNVFNLDEGVITRFGANGSRCSEGDHITILKAIIHGLEVDAPTRSVREAALETMMQYYIIHVPKLKEFETYEIVKELLA